MRRLRRLQALQQLDVPVVLLVGGATGHGQVDARDRGRAPPRHHPRHVDRLHPPDDARVLLPGVHAVGALLELRGRARPDEGRGGRVGRRRPARLPRPDAERARRGRGGDRPGARGGLVDGARGRPSRAGHDGSPCGRERSSSNAWSRSATRSSTAATSGCATRRRTACARWRSTSTACRRSG